MKPMTEAQQSAHVALVNAVALVRLLGDVLHVLGAPPSVPDGNGTWRLPPVPSSHRGFAVDAAMRLRLRGDTRTVSEYRTRYDAAVEELAAARRAKEESLSL